MGVVQDEEMVAGTEWMELACSPFQSAKNKGGLVSQF
jgi:hypothetical protein